jgi:predicted acylesterase/phospholipase RssA
MVVKMKKRFQILSLSGGGYRGLHVARALELLESKIGGRIAKHFDLIAGTSIGGIIGLAISLEIPAEKIRIALEELGPKLFNKPVPDFKHVQELLKQKGISRATYYLKNKSELELEGKQANSAWYDPAPLRELLMSDDFFGKKLLGEVLHPIIVPAIDYGHGEPKFFKTDHHERFSFDKEIPIIDIALGTSAAPVYFPAHTINDFRIVDGGLIANDPTQVAVHEAMKFFGIRPPLYGDESMGTDDMRVLAIGTLSPKRLGDLSKPLSQGLLDWGSGVFDLATSAQEAMSAYMVDIHMLPGKVHRLPTLEAKPESAPNLADVSQAATQMLKSSAATLVQTACGKPEFMDLFEHTATPLSVIRETNQKGKK